MNQVFLSVKWKEKLWIISKLTMQGKDSFGIQVTRTYHLLDTFCRDRHIHTTRTMPPGGENLAGAAVDEGDGSTETGGGQGGNETAFFGRDPSANVGDGEMLQCQQQDKRYLMLVL